MKDRTFKTNMHNAPGALFLKKHGAVNRRHPRPSRPTDLRWLWLVAIGLLLVACARQDEAAEVATPTPTIFSQWAVAAEASSEYGRPGWSARRATGAPEVNQCTDDPRAWASARGNGLAWLELTYEQPVYPTEVRIYQNLGRGGVARLLLIDENGGQHLVWEGSDSGDICPGVFSISVPRPNYRVTGVRVELDESRTGFWNEIDAVELVGVQ
ncbi:MAG: hypothetical protein ACP5HM_13375 [Anaerolineae bacterium]